MNLNANTIVNKLKIMYIISTKNMDIKNLKAQFPIL